MQADDMNIPCDMTKGPVVRQMLSFSLPLMGMHVLQLCYGAADMLIVSRVVGEEGAAVVGNGSMVAFFVASLGMGFGTGGAVLIGGHAARGEFSERGEAVLTLMWLTVLFSVLASVVSCVLTEPVLSLLGVPGRILPETLTYTRMLCSGTVFVFGLHTVCAVLRALGNAVLPLVLTTLSAAANILLDIVFVVFLHKGTAGAAVATVLSQAAALIPAFWFLRAGNVLPERSFRRFFPSRRSVAVMLSVALPASAQMAVVNLSFLIVTGMLNACGIAVVAATGIGLKINTLAGMPCWGMGQAVTAMTAQTLAVGDVKRVRHIVRAALWLNMGITSLIVLVVQASAEVVMECFLPSSSAAGIGVRYLRLCCSVNSLFYVTMYVLDSFAIGAGHAKFAFFNAVIEALVIRVLLSWLLAEPFGMGYMGLYVGQALSPLLPAVFGAFFYARGRWWERRGVVDRHASVGTRVSGRLRTAPVAPRR